MHSAWTFGRSIDKHTSCYFVYLSKWLIKVIMHKAWYFCIESRSRMQKLSTKKLKTRWKGEERWHCKEYCKQSSWCSFFLSFSLCQEEWATSLPWGHHILRLREITYFIKRDCGRLFDDILQKRLHILNRPPLSTTGPFEGLFRRSFWSSKDQPKHDWWGKWLGSYSSNW